MTAKLMKGHTFKSRKHKVTYPMIAEVKLDEIRLDVRRGSDGDIGFQSYADKPLHNLGCWGSKFDAFMHANEVNRLDCGVLINRSFNDTYRYVRSSKGLPDDLKLVTVEFILFDVPQDTRPFEQRCETLDHMAADGQAMGLPLIRPARATVRSEEDVYALYADVRERGFEGLMLKTGDHVYELGKRTAGWLKVKPEDDADGRITAINRAFSEDGTPLDRAGSVDVECEDGSTASPAGFPHELGALMLAHPEQFIGRWLEFTYMERDRQGGYRHPRFHRFREDKA